MDVEQTTAAHACLRAAHEGTLSFPEIAARLTAAGFEGYLVDYRRNVQTFYLPDGDSIAFDMAPLAGPIAQRFDAREVGRLVAWAQSDSKDYSYVAFCNDVKAAGCAAYLVSFLGRRVVYLGRTAETHVEHFPPG